MRVEERMTKKLHTCREGDSLATAAQVLWDHDCGCVPVVDDRGHVQGMLTDRDICMASYTTGRNLHDLQVGQAMAKDVATTRATESMQDAELIMRARRVRRLPVIDNQNRLVGLLTCNDLCRWVDDGGSNGNAHHEAVHLVHTLVALGTPRHKDATVTMVRPNAASLAAERLRAPGNRQPGPAAPVPTPAKKT